MKHLLTILLIAISMSAGAQDAVKYRAFQATYYTEDTEELTWDDVDILVVFNKAKDVIRVFAKKEKNIDLIQKRTPGTTKNGDPKLNFVGVDEDGVKCEVSLIVFKSENPKHLATLSLEYKDVTFVYRLKSN